MGVLQSPRTQMICANAMQLKQMSVALTRGSGVWVCEQIHLARQARKGGHHSIARIVLDDEPADEKRIAQVWKSVLESLRAVHGKKRIEIGVGIFANHGKAVASDERLANEAKLEKRKSGTSQICNCVKPAGATGAICMGVQRRN